MRRARWLGLMGATGVVLFVAGVAGAQPPPAPPPAMPRGLVHAKPGVSEGYVLFSPTPSAEISLIDNAARVMHMSSRPNTGGSIYLRPNGNLPTIRTHRASAIQPRIPGVST